MFRRKRKEDRKVAYFSMEIGIDPRIPTYSGGLGVLAGDTVRSCADLNVPLVAVTLLYKKGYFSQKLRPDGMQDELPVNWAPKELLIPLAQEVMVRVEGRKVFVRAWLYEVAGETGFFVPVIFLDTDLEKNDPYDRALTHYLYGGDEKYRLAQEVILGIGGVRLLNEIGYRRIEHYHMNEGHSALLTLELLKRCKEEGGGNWEPDEARRMCVFTTHTPVPAGHDQFSYGLVRQVLGEFVPFDLLKKLGGEEKLNMTLLALSLSDYVNGVAKKHGKISQEMFPGYHVNFITNGVHSRTWASRPFRELFDKYIPGWQNDPFSLRYAAGIPKAEIWQAHQRAKEALINYLNQKSGSALSADDFTIGFARRATTYKRADLVFWDLERLSAIARERGKIQFVFAGKAHPQDWPGKELIKKVFSLSSRMKEEIRIVYLEDYDIESAKMLVSGVDIWLNTPRKPQEASGTSGMKAAHNGVPSLSILDGWWIEGCIEGITGWSIGSAQDAENNDERDAAFLYEKLRNMILPAFYHNRSGWLDIMSNAIAINASFFNTHRMVQQYVLNAYLY